ncbi:hypothetical protein [Pseudolactococcus carnosus]|uniref:Uncharacterized protein n=1 Tax=Pseudolactococcus carnosus TaxID=2749961 RepID=A0ABT0ART6_9LACT|nr:hypothetical protein [Lactococcus carnosus]MCJ1989409.1 hypothetical protein [Lactococcus carnosus]
MSKNKLDRINEIEQEIKVIDKFLERKEYGIVLQKLKRKFRLSLKTKAYGILGSREYAIPNVVVNEIVNEIVKVLINRKAKLIDEQKEIWGN